MILAADLGGTKCNLALFHHEDGKLALAASHRFETSNYSALPFNQMLLDFQTHVKRGPFANERIAAAGIAGAGAVVDGVLHGTYVPWKLESAALAKHLSLEKIALLNDVEASALSLPFLTDADLLVLNKGVLRPNAPRALIAAGTGLGEALLFHDGHRYRALPTEGGEAGFAPQNQFELELLRHLWSKMPRVACEEILSGSGFQRIHEFLAPQVQHCSFEKGPAESAREISNLAMAKQCAICEQTLEAWVCAYGSEAGNLALRSLAYGGIYVAGGIATKILATLKEGSFVNALVEKGRFAPILRQIPVYLVLNEQAPLWGAAYQALKCSTSG